VHVGQPEVTPLELVGQLLVIDPQQAQHRRMQIVHIDWILDDVVAEVVGAADGDARLDAAACEPHRERAGMMVAAEEFRAVARLVHRCAPELAAPHDERVVEQTALLQIGEQAVYRPVGLAAQVRELFDNVFAERRAVRVPAAMIELNEADSAFD
jgi:hypothetical protein